MKSSQVIFLLFLTFLSLLYILNTYIYRSVVLEHKKLADSLSYVETEYMYVLSRYSYVTRRDVVDSLTRAKGLEIGVTSKPPYIIERDDNEKK